MEMLTVVLGWLTESRATARPLEVCRNAVNCTANLAVNARQQTLLKTAAEPVDVGQTLYDFAYKHAFYCIEDNMVV